MAVIAERSLGFSVSAMDRASSTFGKVAAAANELGRELRGLDKTSVSIDADISRVRAAVKETEQRLTELKRQVESDTPQLDLDISEAEAKERKLRGDLDELRKQKVTPEVELKIAQAEAQLGRLTARLEELRGKKVTPEVHAEIAKAEADLVRFNAQLVALDSKRVSVKVDADTSGATRQIETLDKSFGAATIRIAALGRAMGALAMPGAIVAALPAVASLGASAVTTAGALWLLPAAALAGAGAAATLGVGFAHVSDALGPTGTPAQIKKVNEALAALSPQARATVETIRGLGPAWTSVRLDVQERLFAGMASTVGNLASIYLPILKTGLGGIATELNRSATGLTTWAAKGRVIADMGTVFDGVRATMAALAPVATSIASIFLNIGVVGMQFLPGLAAGFAGAAASAAAFVARARESGQLATWIRNGLNELQLLGSIAMNVGGILGGIFSASRLSGESFLSVLDRVTERLKTAVQSPEGAAALQQFFTTTNQLIGLFVDKVIQAWPAIAAGAGAFAALLIAASPLSNVIFGLVTTGLVPLLNAVQFLAPVLGPALVLFGLWRAGTIAITAAMVAYRTAVAIATAVSVGYQLAMGTNLVLTNAQAAAQARFAIASKAGAAAAAVVTGAQWLLNAALSANPIGLVVIAIAALVAGFIYAYKNSETFRGIVTGALEAVKTAIGGVVNFFKTAFNAVVGFFSEWGTTILAVVAPVIGIPVLIIQHWDQIVAFFAALPGKIASFAANLWTSLTTATSNAMTSVGEFLTNLPGMIARGLGIALGAVIRWAAEFGLSIAAGVTSALEWFRSLPDRISAFFTSAGTWLASKGAAILAGLITGVVTGYVAVTTWFASLPDRISAFFASTGTWLLTTGTTLLIGLLSGIVAGYNAVTAWFAALPGRVSAFFSAAGSWLLSTGASVLAGMLTGIVTGYVAVTTWFAALPGKVTAFFAGAGAWLANVGWDILTGLIGGLVTGATAVYTFFADLISNFLTGFKEGLGIASPSTVFAQFGMDILQGLINGLQVLFGALLGIVQTIWSGLVTAFQAGISVLSAVWSGFWGALQVAASVAWSFITTAVQAGWALVTGAFNAAIGFVAGIWNFFWSNLQLAATIAWTLITVAVQGGWALVTGAFSAAIAFVGGIWSAFWTGLQIVVGAVWTAIQMAVTLGWSLISAAFSAAVALVTGIWSAFWTGLQVVAGAVWAAIQLVVSTGWAMLTGAFSAAVAFLSAVWSGFWTALTTVATTVWNAIVAYFTASFAIFQAMFSAVWNAISLAFTTVWNFIQTTATTVWNAIVAYFTASFALYQAMFAAVWNAVSTVFTTVWNFIRNTALTVWAAISAFFTTAFAAYQAMFTAAWTIVQTVFTTVWNFIRTTAITIWTAISAFFTAAFATFQAFFTAVWTAVQTVFMTVWTFIQNTAITIWNAISAFFTAAFAAFQAFFAGVWNTISAFFVGVWNGLRDTAVNAWNGIRAFFGTVFSEFSGFFASTWNGIVATFDRIWSGITTIATRVWGAVRGAFVGGVNAIIDVINVFAGAINKVAGLLGFNINLGIPRLGGGGPVVAAPRTATSTAAGLRDGGEVHFKQVIHRARGGNTSLRRGGKLPYTGANRDTLPALAGRQPYALMGEEFVVRRSSSRSIGPTGMNAVNNADTRPVDIVPRGQGGAAPIRRASGGPVNGTEQGKPQRSDRAEGARRLAKMKFGSLTDDIAGLAYGGVASHVAAAGDAVTRALGPMPGGIGGVGSRANASDHPKGLALDFMTMGNVGLGHRVAGFLTQNWGQNAVKYLIWQQRIANSPNAWQGMENRGSPTANHMDHVHASFTGDGKPGGGGGGFFQTLIRPIVDALLKPLRDRLVPVRDNQGEGYGKRMVAGVGLKLLDHLVSKADEQDASAGAAAAIAGGAAPPGQINEWIMQALGVLGYPANYAQGIYQQIMSESGGNPNAVQGNIGDINNRTGNLARGIMQVIPPTFAAYALPGHGNIMNPVDNIIAGSRYAMKRYGAGWFAPGPRHNSGYDEGGEARGRGVMLKRTIQPERVLSPRQTLNHERLTNVLGTGGGQRLLSLAERAGQRNPVLDRVQRVQRGALGSPVTVDTSAMAAQMTGLLTEVQVLQRTIREARPVNVYPRNDDATETGRQVSLQMRL